MWKYSFWASLIFFYWECWFWAWREATHVREGRREWEITSACVSEESIKLGHALVTHTDNTHQLHTLKSRTVKREKKKGEVRPSIGQGCNNHWLIRVPENGLVGVEMLDLSKLCCCQHPSLSFSYVHVHKYGFSIHLSMWDSADNQTQMQMQTRRWTQT